MSIDKFTVFVALIWKFLEKGSYQVILFIVTLVLARLLTPDDYGTVAIVLVLINLATVFVEGGLSTALVQKKECTQCDYNTILYFSIIVSIALYSLLWLFSSNLANFFSKPELENIVKSLGLTLILNAVNSVQKAYLIKKMLFKKLFYSSLIGVSISAVIGIFMAYLGVGIWSLVVQQLSMSLLITVFSIGSSFYFKCLIDRVTSIDAKNYLNLIFIVFILNFLYAAFFGFAFSNTTIPATFSAPAVFEIS